MVPGSGPAKRQVEPMTSRRSVTADGSDWRSARRDRYNLRLKGLKRVITTHKHKTTDKTPAPRVNSADLDFDR